jgi:hypothetical protein
MSQLDDFTDAYIECALWSSTDDDGTPLDDIDADLSDDARDALSVECCLFIEANAELLAQYVERGRSMADAGHDFWLTRNGHGAGFWDRGLGALGDELTAMTKPYGSCDLYVGDDGLVYVM